MHKEYYLFFGFLKLKWDMYVTKAPGYNNFCLFPVIQSALYLRIESENIIPFQFVKNKLILMELLKCKKLIFYGVQPMYFLFIKIYML